MSTQTEIKQRIESFVSELDALVRKAALESVHAALGSTTGAAPARRGGRRPGRPRGRATATATVSTDGIVSFVRANDGSGVREIAEGVGIPGPAAKKAVSQLVAEGALKKSGQRRGTKYHVGSGKPARKTKAKKAGKRKTRKKRKTKKAKAA